MGDMFIIQTTKDRIYNVLLFMDGGWMVDRYEVRSTHFFFVEL